MPESALCRAPINFEASKTQKDRDDISLYGVQGHNYQYYFGQFCALCF